MKLFQQLDQMVEKQDGILRTAQVVEAGISKPVFYEYVKDRKMERAAHGIYVSKDSWIDAMYLIHLRFGQAVFSHETALFFHDLTDREPMPYTVTLKTGYNPARLKAEGVQVYTIKPELHGVGLTTAQTPFGHPVPIYDMERTICDLLRSRMTHGSVRHCTCKSYLLHFYRLNKAHANAENRADQKYCKVL